MNETLRLPLLLKTVSIRIIKVGQKSFCKKSSKASLVPLGVDGSCHKPALLPICPLLLLAKFKNLFSENLQKALFGTFRFKSCKMRLERRTVKVSGQKEHCKRVLKSTLVLAANKSLCT